MERAQKDSTAKNILARFNDLEGNPDETISPYLEFNVGGKLYYFTPGGFLYRREPGTEEIGGFFCGYLSEEVWHYRTDEGGEDFFADASVQQEELKPFRKLQSRRNSEGLSGSSREVKPMRYSDYVALILALLLLLLLVTTAAGGWLLHHSEFATGVLHKPQATLYSALPGSFL